ncbi:MAG: hypothetical protein P0Y59_22285 [Candidatus Sphingomonas phytovorans]|nr:hypothetical protein [Sphingomonas sp.]WEJ99603.1 MAG: hypothetical protein P0Y59_22285 [Sphingomonas sp.]
MTRSTPRHFRALPTAIVLVAAVSLWPTASFAQSAPEQAATTTQAAPSSGGDVIRLTDEQRMEILNNNTVEKAAAARGELVGADAPGRGIHGEIGVMIGTNGTRGAYGTANIPLGENAGATVSFESSTFGYPRRR